MVGVQPENLPQAGGSPTKKNHAGKYAIFRPVACHIGDPVRVRFLMLIGRMAEKSLRCLGVAIPAKDPTSHIDT